MSSIGHNSGVGAIAVDELRLLVERVERLTEEKKAITDDIKDVFGEAKSRGYDVKTMRRVIQERAKEKHLRDEQQMLFEIYMAALGLL